LYNCIQEQALAYGRARFRFAVKIQNWTLAIMLRILCSFARGVC